MRLDLLAVLSGVMIAGVIAGGVSSSQELKPVRHK